MRPPAIGCCCSGVWKTGTGLGCRRCDVRQGKALGVELRLFGTSVGCTVSDGREFYLAVPSLGPCALMDCEHWWTYRLQPATGLRLPRPLLWWHCRLEEGGRSKDGGEGSLACAPLPSGDGRGFSGSQGGTRPSVEGAPNHLQTTWVWIGVSYLAEQPLRCDLLKVSLQDPPICPRPGRASQWARRNLAVHQVACWESEVRRTRSVSESH